MLTEFCPRLQAAGYDQRDATKKASLIDQLVKFFLLIDQSNASKQFTAFIQ